MKHLVIYNKTAGRSGNIEQLIDESFKGLDVIKHITTGPKEATAFLRDYFSKEKELTRVYACGGDGTLNEVVNGIAGVKNAELALYPCGTGNDFSKMYGTDRLLNFRGLINGKPTPIDITRVEGPTITEPTYSINVINFGFDAMVGAKGNENKLKGIKDPYGFTHAIVPAIVHGRYNKATIYADGKDLNGKKFLLGSIAQGQFIGGEYHASPKSDNTDGLLDVIVVKTMSLFGLLIKLFGKYHDGKHLDDPNLMKKTYYVRVKEARIEAPEDIDICLDGEMLKGKSFTCTIVPGGINFVVPQE